jgi:hypothetical protein
MRTLLISDDLFLQIVQGFGDGPPRYFDVIADPLPADTKLICTGYSPEKRCVVMELESASWDGTEPKEICPALRCVKMESSQSPRPAWPRSSPARHRLPIAPTSTTRPTAPAEAQAATVKPINQRMEKTHEPS